MFSILSERSLFATKLVKFGHEKEVSKQEGFVFTISIFPFKLD